MGSKTKTKRKTIKRKKNQKGGASSLPLAWFRLGDYSGYTTNATGGGLGATTETSIREQIGGKRHTRKNYDSCQSQRHRESLTNRLHLQSGGFRRQSRRVIANRQIGGFGSQRELLTNRLHLQSGGFIPSIMGAGFTSAGMRLIPAVTYMGYNQIQSYNKKHAKTRKCGKLHKKQ